MSAVKGEVVQAQLFVQSLLPPSSSRSSLRVASLSFEQSGDWSAQGIGRPQLERLWYAPATPDGVVYSSAIVNFADDGKDIATNGFSIPSSDNHIVGQTNQGLWLSIFVPLGAAAGQYSGQIILAVSSPAATLRVPVSLGVYDIEMPQQFTFALDLNSYSDSIAENCGTSMSAETCELLTHQMAHRHRHTCNTLPYGQTGTQASNNPFLITCLQWIKRDPAKSTYQGCRSRIAVQNARQVKSMLRTGHQSPAQGLVQPYLHGLRSMHD